MEKNKNLKLIISPIILTIITIITYLPSLNYPFQFDDKGNILSFYNIRNFNFSDLAFSKSRWLIYWLNTIIYKFRDFDPFTYRCINLIIHITCGILLFYFVYFILFNLKNRKFFSSNSFAIALLITALFLLHPVQTQTVSYITQGQLEGLACLFILAICLFYLFFANTKTKINKIFLGIILILLSIFSTGTKEIIIVTPFLILLIDYFFVCQNNLKLFKNNLFIKILIFTIYFGFFIFYLKPAFFADIIGLKITAIPNAGNILTDAQNITTYAYFISQFKIILHYLFIFIWPFNISADYNYTLSNSFFAFDSFLPFIILLLIFAFIIYLLWRDKTNLFAFGLLWFFICMAPRTTIIPSAELVADYKTYIASIGLFFCFAILITKFFYDKFKFNNKIIIILFILFCFILCLLTYNRNKVWSTPINFWENIIKNYPKARAYNNLGVEFVSNGQYNQAIDNFKLAINSENNYFDAYTNLSGAYALVGKLDLAIATLQESLKINSTKPQAYNNLGALLLHQNKLQDAQKCFEAACKIAPYFGAPLYNLGKLYLAKQDVHKAFDYFKQACTQSDYDHNLNCLEFYGKASLLLCAYKDAIFAFERTLSLSKTKEQIKEALFNLGTSYALDNNLPKAENILKRMTQEFPEDKRGWNNLAEVYVDLGMPDKAKKIKSQIC